PSRAARCPARSCSSVQAPAFDVPPHVVGNKVAQRQSAAGPRPQLARADVEARSVENLDARVGLGRAGAPRDEDRRELADSLRRAPPRKIGKGVAPEDQMKVPFAP